MTDIEKHAAHARKMAAHTARKVRRLTDSGNDPVLLDLLTRQHGLWIQIADEIDAHLARRAEATTHDALQLTLEEA